MAKMDELLMWENPYNPRRRRRKSNPARLGTAQLQRTVGQWTQGVGVEDIVGALCGMAAAAGLPGLLVPVVDTTGKKWMRTAAAYAVAVGAGFVGGAVNPRIGKAAVLGGLAGATSQMLATFFGFKIGAPMLTAGRSPAISRSVPVTGRPLGASVSVPVTPGDQTIIGSVT